MTDMRGIWRIPLMPSIPLSIGVLEDSCPKMRGIGKNSIVYNYCAKRKQKHLVQTVMVLRGVGDPVKGRLYVTVPVPAVFGGSPIHFWRPP